VRAHGLDLRGMNFAKEVRKQLAGKTQETQGRRRVRGVGKISANNGLGVGGGAVLHLAALVPRRDVSYLQTAMLEGLAHTRVHVRPFESINGFSGCPVMRLTTEAPDAHIGIGVSQLTATTTIGTGVHLLCTAMCCLCLLCCSCCCV
jgi:hypothetical protein